MSMAQPESPKARRGRPFQQRPNVGLTADLVLESALRLVHDEGLERLTIGKLGTAMGVSRGPIYSLFKTREILVQALIDHLLESQIPLSVPDSIGWEDRVRLYAQRAFDVLCKYPGVAAALLKSGFPDTKTGRSVVAYNVDLLKEAGTAVRDIPTMLMAITGLVLGSVIQIEGQREREAKLTAATQGERRRYGKRRGDTLPSSPLDTNNYMAALEVLLRGLNASYADNKKA